MKLWTLILNYVDRCVSFGERTFFSDKYTFFFVEIFVFYTEVLFKIILLKI